jgi:alpha-tubulin suppressor-like RCC1 family protein
MRRRQQHFIRSVAAITVLATAATALEWYHNPREVHAEEPLQEVQRTTTPAEAHRELISPQHLQVTKSWEHPGVYLWGSNSGKVVAPDSHEAYIKTPRRLSFFDGVLLRDIKLDRNFGAAIDEKGDLLQWGKAYSTKVKKPTPTLIGKDLVSCAISRDRIIALSSSGSVYSVPVSKEEQNKGKKPMVSSWIPFSSSPDTISYRIRTPAGLGWNEKVTSIASGLEHALLLTSDGRVFSFASATKDFPSRGQLGVPGLTWETRPSGPFDIPREVVGLQGNRIAKVAAGDYHSLLKDRAGRCFAFGDNSAGQLGFEFNPSKLHIDTPTLLPTQALYPDSEFKASVTDVFAGGNTSFMTMEARKPAAGPRDPSRLVEDTWAFGFGLNGQLGVGRWIHNQNTPVKIPALSGLTEYDEKSASVVPIKLAYISAGSTHAAAVMDNVASVDVLGNLNKFSENDTNYGHDLLLWGNNEFYQIGSGKRTNVSTPTYIPALDEGAPSEKATGLLEWGKQGLEKQWHRLQITPKQKIRVDGRPVNLEQRVECGRGVTAVYSAV